jgi:hypothetical protein
MEVGLGNAVQGNGSKESSIVMKIFPILILIQVQKKNQLTNEPSNKRAK